MISLLTQSKIAPSLFTYTDEIVALREDDLLVIFLESIDEAEHLKSLSQTLFVTEGSYYAVQELSINRHWHMSVPKHMTSNIKELADSFYTLWSTNKSRKIINNLNDEISQLRDILNHTPAHIYIKDHESRFLYVNDEWKNHVGIPIESDLDGKTDFDFFDRQHAETAYNDEKEILNSGIPKIAYEEKTILSHGKVSWCLSSKIPLVDHKGFIVGISGISYDISNLKHAQEQLELTNEMLRTANKDLDEALQEARRSKELEQRNKLLKENEEKLKKAHDIISHKKAELELLNQELQLKNSVLSEQNIKLENTLQELKATQTQLVQAEKMASVGLLASGIAHEINNPLNFISGSIKAIEEQLSGSVDKSKQNFEKLFSAANIGIKRATRIVESLNMFNRKSDRLDEDCDIALIIDNCLNMIESRLKHKVQVKTIYNKESNRIEGNEGELHQAFLNIISNAEHSIEKKGEILISTLLVDNKLVIKIKDNGCGIKQEDLDKLATPFYTTKRPGEGTGLGLSITFSIIEKHRGTITYDSQIGKGTTVTLSLPQQRK